MKDLTPEEYAKVLNSVDWYYQRAEGRAYYKGKRGYEKARQLATTPELKEMFDKRRK